DPCPCKRCGAGDEQESEQRHSQKTRREISGQPSRGHHAAENQDRSAAFGKPTFAPRNFGREAMQRRFFEPTSSRKTGKAIEAAVAEPNSKKAGEKRRGPGHFSGRHEQSCTNGRDILEYDRRKKESRSFRERNPLGDGVGRNG